MPSKCTSNSCSKETIRPKQIIYSFSYRLEAGFEPIKLESPFGSYHAEIITERTDVIKYVRHYEQKKGSYPSTSYQEFLKFHRQIVQYDRKKVAFVNKS